MSKKSSPFSTTQIDTGLSTDAQDQVEARYSVGLGRVSEPPQQLNPTEYSNQLPRDRRGTSDQEKAKDVSRLQIRLELV